MRVCVIDHALEIDNDSGFIANNPGVVAARQERNIARSAVEFIAIIHSNSQYSGDMILEMRGLAA